METGQARAALGVWTHLLIWRERQVDRLLERLGRVDCVWGGSREGVSRTGKGRIGRSVVSCGSVAADRSDTGEETGLTGGGGAEGHFEGAGCCEGIGGGKQGQKAAAHGGCPCAAGHGYCDSFYAR
jgi:hypothetical protein